MKKKKLLACTLLSMSLLLPLAGCGGSNGTANSGSTTASSESAGSGCTYDFPQAGFGFELPDSVKLSKGSIVTHDQGEFQYNGNITMAWPVYWNFTEEEVDNLTEDDLDKVHTGMSFCIICSGEGRDLEQTKKDCIAQIEEDTGETLPEEEAKSLNDCKEIHNDGEYTWFMLTQPKSEDFPKEYQAEYDAFYDATDEIIENMTFYPPQIWRGGDEGAHISFKTTDLDGNAVDSKELFAGNKITMINIWGTYCGPCIDEMPSLEELGKDYADKGVGIVGLVVDVPEGEDDALADAKDILADTGVTFQNLRAWDGYDQQLSIPGTPTSYFVDSQGKLVGDPVVGSNLAKYRLTLDKLLKPEP